MKLYELINKMTTKKEYGFANLIMKISVNTHDEYNISECIKGWLF